MKNKKKLIVLLVVLICGLMLSGMFFFKPQLINNNYTLQLPGNISDMPNDYWSYQQLEVYKQNLKDDYNNTVQNLNSKFNILLSIISIAVAVWIGLNIYNLVEKNELDKLIMKEKKLEEILNDKTREIEELTGKIDKLTNDALNLAEDTKNINDNVNLLFETVERERSGFI